MCPNPCATQWNSWFFAVQYHQKHFQYYKDFIASEMDLCKRSPPDSLESIHDMFQDARVVENVTVQLEILAEMCKPTIQMNDLFQSRVPVTTQVFNYLEDLQINFAANKTLSLDSCINHFEHGDNLPYASKHKILQTVMEADSLADELTKYMSPNQGQPALVICHFNI